MAWEVLWWLVTGKLVHLTAAVTWGFAFVELSFPCAFHVRLPLTWTNAACVEQVSLWGPSIEPDTASQDLFAMISYCCRVSLNAPFVNSNEIFREEKKWILSKRCLVKFTLWWKKMLEWNTAFIKCYLISNLRNSTNHLVSHGFKIFQFAVYFEKYFQSCSLKWLPLKQLISSIIFMSLNTASWEITIFFF